MGGVQPDIVIGSIRKEDRGETCAVVCPVTVPTGDGTETRDVEFSVPKEYSGYLLTERSDAFVVLVLRMAVSKGYGIRSEVPVSNDLLFNIKEQFLPPFMKNAGRRIELHLKPAPAVGGGEAVGTGLSCGVDSMHAVMMLKDYPDPEFRLTHLCINNVGAFNSIYRLEGADKVRRGLYARAREAADFMGIPLIETDSNVDEALRQNHYFSHTFTSAFAMLCLKKLWRCYFYASSGVDCITGFSIRNHLLQPPSRYELLTMSCLTTPSMRIYVESPTVSRFEKIEHISGFEPARRFLTSCTVSYDNCCRCDKCMRNMMTMDSLGCLDSFSEVYDLDLYRRFKDRYMWYLCSRDDDHYFEPVVRRFASKKDPDFLRVGRIHDACMAFDEAWKSGNPVRIRDSVEELEPLADAGEVHAAHRVARAYSAGKGAPLDPEKARGYRMAAADVLREEVENGFVTSRIKLFDLLWTMGEDDLYPEMVSLLGPLFEVEDPSAMYRMAKARMEGRGVPKDEEGALELMRRAVALDPARLPDLCDMLLATDSPEHHKEAMDRCLVVERRTRIAAAYIGRMYRDGKGVERDLPEAARWMRKAMGSGNEWVSMELFDILWSINEPEYDRGLLQLVRPGAEAESIPCMGRLGRMFREGRGVDKDVHIAIKWLTRAADLDPAWAPDLCDAVSMSDDEEARASILERAQGLCKEGSRFGYVCMGRILRDGIAADKDPLAAADWYRRAAAEGSDAASLELIDLLWTMNDREHNREMLSIAYGMADAGVAGAMGRLGNIYRFGRGVPKNLPMAERWMAKASSRDPGRWAKSLQAIRESMSSEGDGE